MGQFVDHWDQAHCLKLCVRVCVCARVSVYFHSACAALANALLSQIWWHLCQPKASSGKVGWESLEIGLHSKLPLLD